MNDRKNRLSRLSRVRYKAMMEPNAQRVFGGWVFILLGALIPFVTQSLVALLYWRDTRLQLEGCGFDVCFAGYHSVPFVIAAHFWRKARRTENANYRAARARKTAVVIGAVMLVAFATYVQVVIHLDRSSSTAAIGLLFVPIYSTPVFLIGYGVSIAIAMMRGVFKPNPFPPACRYCGYSLRGIESSHCPECGRPV